MHKEHCPGIKFYVRVAMGMQSTMEISLEVWKWEDKGESPIASSISFAK